MNRTNKAAYTPQGPPSTGDCPLCGRPDSIGHMVGECTHPEITALRVERHNSTTRILLKHVRKGEHGGHYILADVGNPEKLGTVGVNDRLIPKWIIPGSFEPSRVDALIVHKPMTSIPKKGRLPPNTEITVIELGYRNDHNRAHKIRGAQGHLGQTAQPAVQDKVSNLGHRLHRYYTKRNDGSSQRPRGNRPTETDEGNTCQQCQILRSHCSQT
eukprot:jgi/Chrzof1/8822/Cz03g25240.t1